MSFQRDFLSKKISDPLAKIVADLAKQEYQQNFQVQNVDTISAQILSIKTKTKTLSKDKFHVSVKSYDPDQRFYNAVYPDRDKLKLWLKGENSDKLHDYSLTNHNAHLWSGYQVAEQYQRDDPDNMAGHEIVSHANGTHYIHVQDREDLRISDLVVDEPTNDGFTIILRYYPLTYGDSNQESIILSQKVDSSQNRYGHTINVDNEGNVYFYVRYNYRQYFVKIDVPVVASVNSANYAAENYAPSNYITESLTIEESVKTSYDLICQFNYTTKECSVKVYRDGVLEKSASSLTGPTAIPPNCQIHLPLQEGKWSEVQALPNNVPLNQVYDSSSNQFVGTINNPDGSIRWEENNTLYCYGADSNSTYITIPNHDNINNLTELSLSFWIKIPYADNTNYINVIRKGLFSGDYFLVEKQANSRDLKFWMKLGASGDIDVLIPFPNDDDWHFVTVKWKSGEALNINIDNNLQALSSETITGTFATTEPFTIFDSVKSDDMSPLELYFFNRQLTVLEQTLLYNYGPHLAQFPTNLEPQRLMNPNPPAVTNPVVTIYDLPSLSSPTINDYTFINNPSAQNPFVLNYDCPNGTAGGVPVATVYNVLPGTGGTTVNPFTTVYTLPGASSTGEIDADASIPEFGYGQYIVSNLSKLYGKKITEIQCWLDENGATGGTVYLGILKANGTYIKFGTGISLSSLTGGWISFTRQLLTNTYVMGLNDAVGVIWEGATGGSILVRRGGSTHYDVDPNNSSTKYSYQNGLRDDGGTIEWKTPNPDYSMAGTFKTGGDTTGTSPYYGLRNASGHNYICAEVFPANSPMLGTIPTRAEFRVYRDVAANNGTVSIRHIKADGTYWATLYEVNVSTLPDANNIPTTFNFVWENLDYNRQILAGERIGVVTNGLTTGSIGVLSNIGTTNNNYDGSRSYINLRNYNGTWATGTTGLDLSGIIKKGGNTFTAFMKFSSTVTRIYERCVNINSVFYDEPLTRVVVKGRRNGTIPSPSTITARLRNSSNVERLVIGTLDANSINPTLGDIIFTNPSNSTIKVAAGDYVSIEISTCDASNYIELNITNTPYDGTNSLLGTLTSGVIEDLASYDLAGEFYTGGQIDNVSRKRVAQYIDTQDSIFLTVENNRITSFTTKLVAVGAPTGLIYFNIRRGFDDALIFNLGSTSAGGIGTALTGTTVTITNYNNTYILGAKDKISIEFEAGDASNKIGVQMRTAIPNYDGLNSYVSRYNGVEYDYLTTKDLVATMKVGGDNYQPDPNTPPPVLPQNPTDLYILSDVNKRESSFMRCIFGMYLFFNTLLTDQELLQFNITRIDTGNNLPNEIQVTNHSFFRNV